MDALERDYNGAMSKPCKIWDFKRTMKKSCVVSNLDTLKIEGKRKLAIDADQPIRVVLEEDGTEIDEEDYFQLVPDHSTFIFLKDQEIWMPRIFYERPNNMCCNTSCPRTQASTAESTSGSSGADSVDSGNVHNRASHLLDQLCTGNAYKQLLPWLLLRPTDLEEIVNADPQLLALKYPRDTVDAIQEMSHKALMDYNDAQKAVRMLSLYDQAVNHQGNSKGA
ncbi:DNA fragmentation factor subunit alpha-like [Paramacrobiotus metropolitanus]|uniref:DNA fragmentation factor subunit alpha-like n=1 Tax=Paramacrobiotus metropolitanus TaxID=2943436 RepID=UPI002446559D|nr:DNA fragmentation factor subunit alpha-like [Paramacrobiotus metropolitanus]